MFKKVIIQRYEYFEKTQDGQLYTVGYSIRKGEKPLGYPGEKLVQEFEALVKK